MRMTAVASLVLVLGACGAGGDDYTARHGVRVEASEASWLEPADADAIIDRALALAVKLGADEVRVTGAFARTTVVLREGWYFDCNYGVPCDTGVCQKDSTTCRGRAQSVSDGYRIDVAEHPWCVYHSSLLHEFLHVALHAGLGDGDVWHARTEVWQSVDEERDSMASACFSPE